MRWFSTFKACLLCDNRVFGMHCAKLFLHWRLLAKHLSFRCSGHSTVTLREEIGKIVCPSLKYLQHEMGEIICCFSLYHWPNSSGFALWLAEASISIRLAWQHGLEPDIKESTERYQARVFEVKINQMSWPIILGQKWHIQPARLWCPKLNNISYFTT